MYDKNFKDTVPHVTGASSYPSFPPTESYAKSVLFLYKPWTKIPKVPTKGSWVSDFYSFLSAHNCPRALKIQYERVKNKTLRRVSLQRKYLGTLDISFSLSSQRNRYSICKQLNDEPIQETNLPKTLQETGADKDLIQCIELYNTVPSNQENIQTYSFPFHHGRSFNWSKS